MISVEKKQVWIMGKITPVKTVYRIFGLKICTITTTAIDKVYGNFSNTTTPATVEVDLFGADKVTETTRKASLR
jgi:hypothetical protein